MKNSERKRKEQMLEEGEKLERRGFVILASVPPDAPIIKALEEDGVEFKISTSHTKGEILLWVDQKIFHPNTNTIDVFPPNVKREYQILHH